jgi:uncharacterized protein (DUF2235 family)
MPKRIVFCADGTWDSTTNQTNVYKLYRALTTSADQVPYYDDGVGADGNPIEKLLGGAFGDGLFQKVKDGYTKIAHAYMQGDQVYIFGFSRGAFTARSLAGMIAICGLPTANFDDAMVNTAFQAYRDKDDRPALLAQLNAKYSIFDAKLTMVGVWDTVGSLGVPALIGQVDPIIAGFLDTSLHPDVLNAYHALAIDERRAQFPPTLWTNPSPGQTLEQVWFAGVHCDVGGSYPNDANGTCLSNIPLGWMMSKAAALGLTFAPGTEEMYALPLPSALSLDTVHESWSPLWLVPRNRSVDPHSWIADSVAVRLAAQKSWRPGNLSFTADGLLAPGYYQVNVVTAAGAASV